MPTWKKKTLSKILLYLEPTSTSANCLFAFLNFCFKESQLISPISNHTTLKIKRQFRVYIRDLASSDLEMCCSNIYANAQTGSPKDERIFLLA